MQRRRFLESTLLASFCTLDAITQEIPKLNPEQSEVINAGIGGNNTVDLLNRIDKDCLAFKPRLTVLMVGTNDMNSRKYIAIDGYEKNVQEIIDKIKRVNSEILIMNLLPVYEPYLLTRHNPEFYKPEGHNGRLSKMNELIKNIAVHNRVSFLDLHHIFKSVGNIGLEKNSLIKNEANSNTADGLHPTPDGYRVIALAVYDSIMRYKLPTEKIVCFGDSITFGDGADGGYNYPSYLKKLLS